MASWITEIFQKPALMGQYAVLATVAFVATLVLSFAVSLIIVIRLPPDYFRTPRVQSVQNAGHGIFFGIGIVLKHFFGVILIILGAILSVPGLPGQGLLTVLAGVLLLDFRGKRKLLCKMLSRPLLLQSINRMRTKFSRPPLVIG